MSRYQKGKTNLDFTAARDSEWQWHQLGHMQVCTLLQTDNHASTPPLSFLQAGCPSCRPTNSVKALKAHNIIHELILVIGSFCWSGSLTFIYNSEVSYLIIVTLHVLYVHKSEDDGQNRKRSSLPPW